MRISPENNINRQNYNITNEKIQNNQNGGSASYSATFEKRAERNDDIDKDNSFYDEAEKIKKNANFLINDFNVEKEDGEVLYRIAENIKRFSDYEYKSAKEVLDETGTLVKNERKKRTINGITYRREKKKRFGGGIEIIDDANKQITRKIYKDRNEIIITTYDKTNSCCIYSFDEKGILKSYIEGVKENEKGYSAKHKFTYKNGQVVTAEKDFEYHSSGDETAKKHFEYEDKQVINAYITYKRLNNETQTILANSYFKYKKEYPYQYYKKYESTIDLNETFKEKCTYEVNDYITYLKEYITEEYTYKFEFNKLTSVNKNNIKAKESTKLDIKENTITFNDDVFD